ncbi:hypothetical protein P3G55_21845 [Leptospira sp. 96542]|nr:hypothetical protein [Leptospira sp. 96542]
MKKIKLLLEYRGFPIWNYDDEEGFIGHYLPEEMEEDKKLEQELNEIQDIFDELYLDTKTEFDYIGFNSPTKELAFNKRVNMLVETIKSKYSHQFLIIDHLSI